MKRSLVVHLTSLAVCCVSVVAYAARQNPPLPTPPKPPGAAEQNAKKNVNELPRVLVLDARKLSTMQKELDTAAAAGYRVNAATVDAQEIGGGVETTETRTKISGHTETSTQTTRTNEVTIPLDEMKVTLSKATEPPDTYQYKLVTAFRAGTMEKELNEWAAQGYRMIPGVMLQKGTMLGSPELVLMMEKAPKAEDRYTYRVLATDREGTLKKEIEQAVKAGFLLCGATMFRQRIAFMEKPAEK